MTSDLRAQVLGCLRADRWFSAPDINWQLKGTQAARKHARPVREMLRQLEDEGVVESRTVPAYPLAVQYRLLQQADLILLKCG